MAGPGRHRRHARVREAAEARYQDPAATGPLTGVLLDSDVIIEVLRGRREVVDAALALEASGVATYCSAIAWAEIYAGIRPGEEALTRAFFESRGEVILDARTGRRAGEYLSRFAGSHGVEIADALVAASAATTGLRLWALNRRRYPMQGIDFFEA